MMINLYHYHFTLDYHSTYLNMFYSKLYFDFNPNLTPPLNSKYSIWLNPNHKDKFN